MREICPFVGRECDGGTIYENGMVGCGFKETPESQCDWSDDVPDGTSPRDFYNEMIMEAVR